MVVLLALIFLRVMFTTGKKPRAQKLVMSEDDGLIGTSPKPSALRGPTNANKSVPEDDTAVSAVLIYDDYDQESLMSTNSASGVQRAPRTRVPATPARSLRNSRASTIDTITSSYSQLITNTEKRQ